MFTYDAVLGEAVYDYCRERLSLDPIPLDFGSYERDALDTMQTMVTDDGMASDRVLAFFKEHLAKAVISIDTPRFLAFIPNAPTKASTLFDMIVAASGLNDTSWLEAAGAVVAENQALTFLAERCGMPVGSGGAFVSGGSLGNLSGLTVGRDLGRSRRPDLAPHTLRFAISADAHSSVGQSLHILGIEPLLVPTDDHRFTLDNLRAALAADPHPETVIGVVATCGTTNAGIIDDLEGLGSYAREHQLWFHVDGAYGGAAMFAPSQGNAVAGLRHADSFIVDPHKWLFAPLDCAALLYRDPRLARQVHTQQAGYLDILHAHDDDQHVEWNPSDYAIHLSRRARGLPFWFSLVTNGVRAYETAVEAGIELAEHTARRIADLDHLELVREPGLSIVLFRRPGWTEADYNAWSEDLLRRQIAFVTPTKWEGETIARLSFLHPDTSHELVEQILDSLR